VGESNGSLRIGELARRTGCSPALLRAWEQRYGVLQPARTKGGFRLYRDSDVARVRRMRELIAGGLAPAEAARVVLEELQPTGPALDASPTADAASEGAAAADLVERLEAALERFDDREAQAVLDEVFARLSVESAIQRVVLPYLERLGTRWSQGIVTIAQEHFASNVLRARLLGLARGWGSGVGPLAVLACPPGEEHELGLIAFGLVLSRRGWRVAYLGADTPLETLTSTVDLLEPAVVVLAAYDPERLRPHREAIRRLAASVPVAIGGALGDLDPEELGVRALASDVVAAAAAL
jgi:DNA-binding transcriptional MerR regulator